MEVTIRKMGNSQGVLIPKPILAQLGLEGTATVGSGTTSAMLGVGMFAAAGYLYWKYGRK